MPGKNRMNKWATKMPKSRRHGRDKNDARHHAAWRNCPSQGRMTSVAGSYAGSRKTLRTPEKNLSSSGRARSRARSATKRLTGNLVGPKQESRENDCECPGKHQAPSAGIIGITKQVCQLFTALRKPGTKVVRTDRVNPQAETALFAS